MGLEGTSSDSILVVRQMVREALKEALRKAGVREHVDEIHLERPKDTGRGDLSSNVALVTAGRVSRNPGELAGEIVSGLEMDSDVIEGVEVAGPGFINFRLSARYLAGQIAEINRLGGQFGNSGMGKGKKIQVEFVSANPTGPLVIVSARAAAVGAALVNLLRKTGFEADAEYYVNDAGSQVDKLGRSVMIRFMELLGEEVEFPEDGYPGKYLIEIAEQIPLEEGRKWLALDEGDTYRKFGNFAIERIMELIRRDLEDFGVEFDNFFMESGLYGESGEIEQALRELRESDRVYEKEGALWFRATEFGDEKDRVLIRSDGSPTYFLADSAYHLNKFNRGYSRAIDLWGPDHHGHIIRMKAASMVLGADPGWLEIMIVQWVRLIEEGKEISMSKRRGEFVSLRDLITDVGVDAAKFFFLMRKTNAHLDFDLTLARKQSEENPVYYVQYAHARISSVISYAREEGVDFPDDYGCVEFLNEPEELELIRELVIFPQLIQSIVESRDPHHLTTYAQQVAATFHHFYHICRIVSQKKSLSQARLLLAEATRIVLAESLRLIGVSAPERM